MLYSTQVLKVCRTPKDLCLKVGESREKNSMTGLQAVLNPQPSNLLLAHCMHRPINFAFLHAMITIINHTLAL